MLRWILATIAACAFTGGAGCDDSLDDLGPASAELGGGIQFFEPLTEGADISIIENHQGTYNFSASIRVIGIRPGDPDDPLSDDNPTTELFAYRDGARIDAHRPENLGFEPVEGSTAHELLARVLLLDIADTADLDGQSVRLEVRVTDADGRVVGDRRDLIARADDSEP